MPGGKGGPCGPPPGASRRSIAEYSIDVQLQKTVNAIDAHHRSLFFLFFSLLASLAKNATMTKDEAETLVEVR